MPLDIPDEATTFQWTYLNSLSWRWHWPNSAGLETKEKIVNAGNDLLARSEEVVEVERR